MGTGGQARYTGSKMKHLVAQRNNEEQEQNQADNNYINAKNIIFA